MIPHVWALTFGLNMSGAWGDKHPTHILWQRSLILNPQKPALSTHPSKLWNSLRNVRIEGMKHLVFVLYWLGLRDSVKHSLQALTYTSINNMAPRPGIEPGPST